MLIRVEQMQAFQDDARKTFVRGVAAHLRSNFSDDLARQGIPQHNAEDLVRAGIVKANSYAIETRSDVTKYVELMAMLGPSFDRDESRGEIAEILHDPVLPGHQKIDAILVAIS